MHALHRFRVIVLTFSLSMLQIAGAQRIQATLGNRGLELGLLHLSDRTLVPWPDTEIQLTTQSVVAGSDFNLSQSLSANGIEPDLGAYSLFYELNPRVTKASTILSNATVIMPKIVAGAKIQPLLANGENLVVLFLDSDLRDKIADANITLQPLYNRFSALPKNRFHSIQEQTTVVAEVGDLAQWYDHIATTGRQRKGPPLNRETLQQLLDEANTLSAVLSSFLGSNGKLPPQNLSQIDAIRGDVKREIRRYDDILSGGITPDPDLVACCTVVVAIKGDPAVVSQLRVYYTLNGLFRNPPPGPVPGSVPFPELGSEKSRTLRAKNYMFWAVKEGTPDILVTSPVMVPLDPTSDNKPTRVDLLLLPQYQKAAGKTGQSK